MKFLTHEESLDWMAEVGVNVADGFLKFSDDEYKHCEAQLPKDRSTYWIAMRLADVLDESQVALCLVHDWGVFPNHENLHLYYKWRVSLGDTLWLSDRNGHLFLSYERVELVTLLHIVLINGWGIYLVSDNNYRAVQLSHEGVLSLHAQGDMFLSEFKKSIVGA